MEADRIRQYAEAVHEDNPVYHDADAAKEAGFRDLVAPPMFAVVYSAPAMGPAIFDTIGERCRGWFTEVRSSCGPSPSAPATPSPPRRR